MIKYQETFDRKPAAGFDGIFNWDWTDGCFGDTRIAPMDVDGLVERKGNFLLFETKDVGKPVPRGQMITLEALYALGCFTVMFVYGKEKPESIAVWDAPGFRTGAFMDSDRPVETSVPQARAYCARWYEYANSNPKDIVENQLYSPMPDYVGNDKIKLPGEL